MPVPAAALMRPDDAELYRQALRHVRQRTGVPLAFAGMCTDRTLVLTEFLGARTDNLLGLRVEPGKGVGGTVLASGRPHSVNDYRGAATITHDYDEPVLGEGIGGIVGVPVTVRGTVRGVLYAAVRATFPLGDRATTAMVDVSARVADELSVRDEVDRRLRLMEAVPGPREPGELRELHDELCGIADDLGDPALRTRLREACDRFAALGAVGRGEPADARPPLSPRETDVLAQVALGCSNIEAARRLGLEAETVKAYLRSATRKLGVNGRYQAVLAARRTGLLP